MKTKAAAIEDRVDDLLIVLDKDIQHIQESLSRLNELRTLVIKRDDVALGKLLEEIRAEAGSFTANELKRWSIREGLAVALGCNFEQMTLSRLETILPEEKRVQAAERKTKLRSLTEELKKEHLSTAMLLSECARFNNMLLKSIFDFGNKGTLVYSSRGTASRHSDGAFVSLQL